MYGSSGGGSTIVQQPSYGEGLADAMQAQLEMLLGTGDFAKIYEEAGITGGLQGTAQIEGETQRAFAQQGLQTTKELLGVGTQTADDQGRILTGYKMVEGTGTAGKQVDIVGSADGGYKLVDANTGDLLLYTTLYSPGVRGSSSAPAVIKDANGNIIKDLGSGVIQISDLIQAGKDQGIYAAGVEPQYEPTYETGYQPGQVVRSEGLLDLYGPSQARQIDPVTGEVTGYGQAGFTPEGEFKGLITAQQEAQQTITSQQRASDIADVELLGQRATEAIRQQGQIQPILDQLAGIQGAGITGLQPTVNKLTALQEKGLTSSDAALGVLTALQSAGIGGMVSALGEIQSAQEQGKSIDAALGSVRSVDPTLSQLRGVQSGLGSLAPIRQNLLAQGQQYSTQGLNQREIEQIQQASRAAGVAAGRTRDIGRIAGEVTALTEADRQRQMENLAISQGIMSNEAALQQQQYAQLLGQLGAETGLQQQEFGQALASLGAQTGLQQQQYAQALGLLGAQTALQEQQYSQALERIGTEAGLQQQQFGQGATLLGAQSGLQQQQFGQGIARLGAETSTAADPLMAILGRPSSAAPGAQSLLASGTQMSQQAGPQYLNPESGLGYIQNAATNQTNLAIGQMSADAQRSAGIMGALGQIGAAAAPYMLAACWVAREVYGVDNPKWLQFRRWMFEKAPVWFFKLYVRHGEKFAAFIKDKPFIKGMVKLFMDSKIKA